MTASAGPRRASTGGAGARAEPAASWPSRPPWWAARPVTRGGSVEEWVRWGGSGGRRQGGVGRDILLAGVDHQQRRHQPGQEQHRAPEERHVVAADERERRE